ncbi:hypothetical protein FB567DRAFT_335523 [Paraphoma chrysanthemicola]|uniref:Secreted protein n=1 Tax=Paraphoma chrysanthemicola TaxID=798071 RepID=A0A8K0R7N5_9PLEO|nr:hypothetical protein FB567DRAFT_335523 [Paraphoma chrysanthemicola]
MSQLCAVRCTFLSAQSSLLCIVPCLTPGCPCSVTHGLGVPRAGRICTSNTRPYPCTTPGFAGEFCWFRVAGKELVCGVTAWLARILWEQGENAGGLSAVRMQE